MFAEVEDDSDAGGDADSHHSLICAYNVDGVAGADERGVLYPRAGLVPDKHHRVAHLLSDIYHQRVAEVEAVKEEEEKSVTVEKEEEGTRSPFQHKVAANPYLEAPPAPPAPITRQDLEQALENIRDNKAVPADDARGNVAMSRVLKWVPTSAARSKGAGGAAAGMTRSAGARSKTRGRTSELRPRQSSDSSQLSTLSRGTTVKDGAAEELATWADEMLQQLHALPAVSGSEEGLLQVKVRSHEDKDDEEGELLPVAPLDRERPTVRAYTVAYDVLVKTTIRNLGEQPVTLIPVYFCVKPAGEETDRQDQVTLKSGEEAEMEFPVQLDQSEGETETGWRFEDPRAQQEEERPRSKGASEASDAVVLHVRILPPA